MKDDPAAGMIQQYLEHDKVADEDVIGLTEINLIPDFEVHKIGLLDIRLFNEDRHGGNLILDQKKGTGALARLVPIDHELTLPHWNQLKSATFCWINWKQVFFQFMFCFLSSLTPTLPPYFFFLSCTFFFFFQNVHFFLSMFDLYITLFQLFFVHDVSHITGGSAL
jgi:hypothetical protein